MNPLIAILLVAAIATILFALVRGYEKPLLPFANLGVSEHQEGVITYKADAALTTRYLLVKTGSDAAHVAVCGAANPPIGIAIDEPAAAEDLVAVRALGAVKGTVTMVASEVIAVDALVYTAASGKVQDEPATAGTYYLVGKAAAAATGDGDTFEVIPCTPLKLVVVATFTSTDGVAAAASANLAGLAAEAEKIGDDVRSLRTALSTAALLKVL